MRSVSQPELWRQRYEALRQHALSGRNTLATPPLGLHLLRQQGVAGWMERWSEAVEPSVIGATPPPPSLLCTAGWQEQLTVLLAQMTLQQINPARMP
ncbi:MAG: hypothetical protein HYS67_01805 [Deltaproteobacteria bacterium]|nr:hypothetical protein [Deltaproteobacteria bacterium]